MSRPRAERQPDASRARDGGDDATQGKSKGREEKADNNTVRRRRGRTASAHKVTASSTKEEAKRGGNAKAGSPSTDTTLQQRAEAEIVRTLQSIEDSLATLPSATYISGGSGSTKDDGRGADVCCTGGTPKATRKKCSTGQAATRWRWVGYAAPAFLLGLLLLLWLLPLPSTSPARHPCLCALKQAEETGAARLQPLVNTLLSKPQGISGIHVRDEAALRAVLRDLAGCPIQVEHVHNTVRDVAQLHDTLTRAVRPRRSAASQCVIWVAPLASVRGVANALKELLEYNQLLSRPVLPSGSRGLLIVVADMSRDELKELIPHRVVHMLRSIAW